MAGENPGGGDKTMRLLADMTFIAGAATVTHALVWDRHRYRAALGLVVGLVLVAVALGAGATSARATTLTGDHPALHRMQGLVDFHAAKGRLPVPEGTVEVRNGIEECSLTNGREPRACALMYAGRLHIRPHWGGETQRATFLHELGHIFDYRYLTDDDRAWFTRRMRMTGLPWLSHEVEWSHRAGEAFAEAYSFCRHQPWFLRSIAPFGDPEFVVYGRQALTICRWLRGIGRRGPIQ